MVAQRLAAFDMRIIGHDPYITRDRLSGLPVELLPSTTCSPAPTTYSSTFPPAK